MPQDFSTTDIQLASYLAALGHTVTRVTGPPDRRCFVFAAVPAEVIVAYHQDSMTVSPHRLFRSYRQLKRLL